MKDKYIDKVTYSMSVKETLFAIAESFAIEDEINMTDDLAEDWEAKLIKVDEHEIKLQLSVDYKKIIPNVINKNHNETQIIRYSPCVDFKTICKDEVKIFDNIEKPIEYMNLVLYTKIPKQQLEELLELLKKAYKSKYAKEIKMLAIDCVNIVTGERM